MRSDHPQQLLKQLQTYLDQANIAEDLAWIHFITDVMNKCEDFAENMEEYEYEEGNAEYHAAMDYCGRPHI